jgi:hypothetical protein
MWAKRIPVFITGTGLLCGFGKEAFIMTIKMTYG